MRTFDPWVGSRYASPGFAGVRVLILGEAHYGRAGSERATFTTEMIRTLGQRHRFRFYTTTQRLLAGGSGWASDAERHDFWERVAFYNYIQTFPGPGPRVRPTDEMWATAGQPLLTTLAELRPQLLLILGRELSSRLPELPPDVRVCPVPHPSSRGFRYTDWQPFVRDTISAITAAAPPTPG